MPKHTLIIGASSGIGFECAALFKERGSIVTNLSRTPSAAADNNVLCDVTCAEFTEILYSVLASFADIDAIIYSAGFSMAAPVEYASCADTRYLFDVNFFGFADCARIAMPFLRDRRGTLAAVGSLGGVVPISFGAYYSASKAALNMFVRELACEAAPYGVKVLCVMPGGTATDFTFKRKVYDYGETGVYAEAMKSAANTLALIEQSGMAPRSVAQTVVEAVSDAENGTLKSNIVASGLPNKAVSASAKLLPKKFIDYMSAKLYAGREF